MIYFHLARICQGCGGTPGVGLSKILEVPLEGYPWRGITWLGMNHLLITVSLVLVLLLVWVVLTLAHPSLARRLIQPRGPSGFILNIPQQMRVSLLRWITQ